ncbi:MAG: hypothetical protein M5R36_29430 [Deltaproteobacteria bacterium]|nr:hypothetical protein [Deltaproteobacteria bacterium]
MSNQATRFVRYACWMVLIATLVVMHPAAAGAIDLPPADHRLLFLLQDNDEFVSLSRKDFGAPDWRVATVPIPASTAYNLWASRPIERPSGEYWVFFNAYAWYILGDFDYRNVTIGYAIYAYHPDTNTWSLILDRLDSRINVDDVMALDDGSIAMTYYGYDSETHFIRTNGWSVSNVGVWDSEADTVSWSPAWNVGVSWFAEFVHDYLCSKATPRTRRSGTTTRCNKKCGATTARGGCAGPGLRRSVRSGASGRSVKARTGSTAIFRPASGWRTACAAW